MASSSSSSTPSAPMFTSQSWSYDVFLSFRGEDTRKTFVDHLYSALVQQGIDTYKDDETIPRGESIGPSLMKAIEESQIAVIVFSVNYADSSWCLDELAHIMKCKDTTGQIVMPIFYDVDPSTVRKQNEKYGKAFVKHKLLNKNKVEAWKKALVDASNISGWEPKKIANGHESKAIKEIVEYISSRLQVSASANEKLIGMSDRVQRLQSELQIGSGGVRMIGIWGVGGGGKTTLASCTYDEIYRKFDGCCFIANIREKSRKHGLEKLQKKILKKIEGKSGGKGRCLIDKKLRNRRVLIVLDDVDQLDQLEALAGSPDWFGDGSRILITTRDEHILKAHKVVVHDISLLQGDEAIKLFRKHAFRGCLPMKDYEQLSEEVVYYAGGLPLALTVLGSSLCDKNIDQWRSALARLQEIPDDKILEKLKISFDGLTKVQKDLFLDIACFFRWEKKDEAMGVLNACGFHPVIGVEELRQKGLITISHGCLDMHDLVQDMGHHIIRGEHPKNPKKYTRVWMKEDVLRLCAMDATMDLDKIEGLRASFLSYTEFTEYFEGSLPPKLDEYFRIPANREPIPPILANMRNLRYIDWKGDHANPLLNTFPPRELCCLILRGSMQDQLWNGYKIPLSLAVLKALFCYSLKTFGDTLYRKWLWKVSVYGSNEIDPLDGWMLLNSMFQGNAFEDHFISATVQYQIPKGVFGRLFWGNKFTLHLPPNWYDNFSGFVLHAVNAVSINDRNPEFDIIIKKEVDEDSRFRVYNEELEPEDHPGSMITYVGYVSFNSLRNTMCLNSTYKMISFSGMACSILDRVGVELVRKDDSVQTKEAVEDRSEFWDEELFHRSTFTIEHGSKSSIKIKWLPNYF